MRRLLLLALLLAGCASGARKSPTGRPFAETVAAEPAGCAPLTLSDRLHLLSLADPANFPATRYRKGSSPNRPIEKETDCSKFVHEIYRRAGFPYRFRSTHDLADAEEFDLLPEKEAQPGDLMLFRGHVGIVGKDGKIISALRTRHRRRKSSIEALSRDQFPAFRGHKRYVLRYRCRPIDTERALAGKK